jgi:hypothetical protein
MLLLVAAIAAPAAAQNDTNPLLAARDLYASARYDEALEVLDRLRPSGPADRKSIEQYRSLCLLALGRGSEAESAIGAVVTADPMYQPSESDASPRVRAAFTEVRQKLLPEIATARYTAAKAAFDRAEYAEAERQFRHVLALLDDPAMGGRLPDLRVLVDGFVALSARAAAPPEPKPEPEPEPAPRPEPAKPAGPAFDPGHVFGPEDPTVVPPAPIRQDLPPVPSSLTAHARDRGLLELVIDEKGRVTSLKMRISVHPVYDGQLLVAARDWRYRPATLDGRPVKFKKSIQIAVKR